MWGLLVVQRGLPVCQRRRGEAAGGGGGGVGHGRVILSPIDSTPFLSVRLVRIYSTQARMALVVRFDAPDIVK